jgi:AraC-like DNA-binding protein
LPEWWLAETDHMLAMLVLSEERHNYSFLFDNSVADPSREQVRRAEEYIEANRYRGISIEDLAGVSDVSVLSLYRAFKRVRGCSPLQYASRMRAAGRIPASDPA